MKINNKPPPSTGRMILIYSYTGVGKTVTALQTSPEPILYMQLEERSIAPSIAAVGRKLDLDIAEYTGYDNLLGFVNNIDNFDKYATVIVDSLTHLGNIKLSIEIEDQSFDARSESDKEIKPLVKRAKLSQEGYGSLASNLNRFCQALGRLSKIGKIVVVTALLKEHPKYDLSLSAAPNLKGREFPDAMPGHFDLIGKLSPRVDASGCIVYPPWVEFDSPDDSFMCKFTGVRHGERAEGVLNIKKILGMGGGEKAK